MVGRSKKPAPKAKPKPLMKPGVAATPMPKPMMKMGPSLQAESDLGMPMPPILPPKRRR